MDLQQYIPRPPVTEASAFDGTADTALSEWCSGALVEDPDHAGTWLLEVPVWSATYIARAGDVVFRTKNGMGGTWSPFAVMNPIDFEAAFMPNGIAPIEAPKDETEEPTDPETPTDPEPPVEEPTDPAPEEVQP